MINQFPRRKSIFFQLDKKYVFGRAGHRRAVRAARTLLWVLSFGFFLTACRQPPEPVILDNILAVKEITVITRKNPWCYYLYRDQPMGFEYDLAKAFADYLGVQLKVRVVHRWDRMIPDLLDGKGDFIAACMAITPARQTRAAFSRSYLPIQQHIIANRRNLKIKGPEDLAGKTVHVTRGTSYHERLEALQAAGIEMAVVLHECLETTELIRMVAEETIDITMADNLVAMLAHRYYPQIVLAGPINDEEFLGWAVNPKANQLLERINTFLSIVQKNGEFDRIYKRYFTGIDQFDFVDLRAFHQEVKKTLPEYLPFIQLFAERDGFDWRLIAAQMYQESHYDPLAVSHRGAHGLMQISLNTAENLGVTDIYDPRENIEAGIRHLKELFDFYHNARGKDRLFIALAAYNVGMGHILDARNIARQQHLDPDKWSSLKKTLPLLTRPEYYEKTKYGYCRGTEPIDYINKINIYYDILKYQGVAGKTD